MVEATRYISQIVRTESEQAQKDTAAAEVDTSVSIIFGGQIKGGDADLYLIYSAGNFITSTEETPYFQIGESKYGKPILDRIISHQTSLEDAARCTIVSMDSTIKSNATVGPPIEVLVYEKDTFETDNYIKMEEDDNYLREVKQAWNEALNSAFSKLPLFQWEKRTVNLQTVTDHFQKNTNK
jgi:putative proteasome-type protease